MKKSWKTLKISRKGRKSRKPHEPEACQNLPTITDGLGKVGKTECFISELSDWNRPGSENWNRCK